MQTIKDLMSRDVQVIDADATMQEAAQRMLKGNFGMMPVAENDRMMAILPWRAPISPLPETRLRTSRSLREGVRLPPSGMAAPQCNLYIARRLKAAPLLNFEP